LSYLLLQVSGAGPEIDSVNPSGSLGVLWIVEQLTELSRQLTTEINQELPPIELIDVNHWESFGRINLVLIMRYANGLDYGELSGRLYSLLAPAGLQIDIEPLTPEKLQSVIEQHRQSQTYVLSVLCTDHSFELLCQLNKVFNDFGLQVISTHSLSNEKFLHQKSLLETEQAALSDLPLVFEYRLMGPTDCIDLVREQLLVLSESLDVDLLFQQDDVHRSVKRLVVFDMDSTLIKTEVINELAEKAGIGDQVREITERAMRGELDFSESFKQRLSLLKGLPETVISQIAETLPLMDGAKILLPTLRAFGIKTAIVSGGFTYFAKYLQKLLGIDYVFANELEVHDGHLTGQAQLPIVDAQMKAHIVRELAQDLGFSLQQVVAVGDGANDLLMLEAVGTGIAFRAKPLVRQSAKLAITTAGLEGVLFLMGLNEKEVMSNDRGE